MTRQLISALIAFTFGIAVTTIAYQIRERDGDSRVAQSEVGEVDIRVELERLQANNTMLQRNLDALREVQATDGDRELAGFRFSEEQARKKAAEQKEKKEEEKKRDREGNVWSRLTSEERSEIRTAWRNQRKESRILALDARLNLEDWERERVRDVYETDWDEVDLEAKESLLAEYQTLPEDELLRIDMMALDEEDQMRLMMMRRSIPQEKYQGYLSYLEDRDISERSSRAAEMLGRVASAVPLRSEQRSQVLELFMNDGDQSGSWRRFHDMESMEELDAYYEDRIGKLASILDEQQFAAYAGQVLLEKEAAATMMEIMLSKREE